MSTARVLVVGAAPAPVGTSATIDLVVDRLVRAGVGVERWYLFPTPHQPRPAEKVVDDLRVWLPSRLTSMVGLSPVAGRLRGLRLRSWFREAAPDVVLLDDRVGGRLLGAAGRRPRIVVRPHPDPLPEWDEERRSCPRADATLRAAGVPLGGGGDEVVEPSQLVLRHAGGAPSPASLAAARGRLALPEEVPLLTGWGDDGWLDGPDLLVRALWVLEHRHGRRVHGAWFGLEDRAELRRLEAEAERCGVRDRFHLRPLRGEDAFLVGDVVALPLRADRPGLDDEVCRSLLAGAGVVTFPTVAPIDPDVEVVPVLDVAALAAAADRFFTGDRAVRRDELNRRWDRAVDLMVAGVVGSPR